ncbi:hypothetical protein Dimus_014262 [Dionaea muscipula]
MNQRSRPLSITHGGRELVICDEGACSRGGNSAARPARCRCSPHGAAREVEGLRVAARSFRLPGMPLLATWSCSIAPPLAGARCSPLQAARRILMQGGNMLAQVIAGRQDAAARMASLLANSHG